MEVTGQVARLNRRFSWCMLRHVRAGWPFALETEIRKMLELMPDPDEVEIILRKAG